MRCKLNELSRWFSFDRVTTTSWTIIGGRVMPHGFSKAHVKCGVAQIGPQQKAPSVHPPQAARNPFTYTYGRKVSFQDSTAMMIHAYYRHYYVSFHSVIIRNKLDDRWRQHLRCLFKVILNDHGVHGCYSLSYTDNYRKIWVATTG